MKEKTILLVGNPNVGKTSVYNRLTRSGEHVGNWHGVTVEEKFKIIKHQEKALKIFDLPGLYSLTVYSPDEAVSRNRILGEKEYVAVNVCDANNLARNLFLTLQLMEAGANVIIAVNMIDELNAKDMYLDEKLLEKRLGVPVVSISAKKGKSSFSVLDECLRCVSEKRKYDLPYLKKLPVESIERIIEKNALNVGIEPRYAAIKILENDSYISEKLALTKAQQDRIHSLGDLQASLAKARYEYIDEMLTGTITLRKTGKSRHFLKNITAFTDKIVLNRFFALPVFFAIVLAVFFITFGLIGPRVSALIDRFISVYIRYPINTWLKSLSAPGWIIGLICDGIISGMGGIMVFLPQILLLFFFLAVMEDSGYISRVAFMTDGMFEKIGLSGKSAFTLLMGFGCSATAVLTSRGLEDEKMRKKTAILTPFMSCSARLPVYSTIASAYFARGNFLVVFGLYVLGVIVALGLAVIMEHCTKRLKSGKPSFIMEMPPYRFPTAERIVQILWVNLKTFLFKVGTTIFALSVIMWILSNFSLSGGYGSDSDSIMMTTGKILAFAFKPLGFGSWKAVTALFGGVVAKEAVISTIESLGGVSALFSGEYAAADALSFMVFTLLYVPCIATVAALIREVGVKWATFGVILQLVTAYIVTLIVRCVMILFLTNAGLAVGLCVVMLASIASLIMILSERNKNGCRAICAFCAKNCQ